LRDAIGFLETVSALLLYYWTLAENLEWRPSRPDCPTVGARPGETMSKPVLLSIIELGGYPNFGPLYEQAGFEVAVERRMRKAMTTIKKLRPAVIVAEFNFQSDFRDRTSSLEPMMSVVQRLPDTRVIVFYEKEYQHQFDRLLAVHRFHRTFCFPIPANELADCVRQLARAD
jgi:hypothetical protein